MFWVGLGIGVFIGVFLGVLILGMCFFASEADKKIETASII